MVVQIFSRLPQAIAFLRCDVYESRAESLEFGLIWLQLSQALAAVRSPGAAEKFHDQDSLRKKIS